MTKVGLRPTMFPLPVKVVTRLDPPVKTSIITPAWGVVNSEFPCGLRFYPPQPIFPWVH